MRAQPQAPPWQAAPRAGGIGLAVVLVLAVAIPYQVPTGPRFPDAGLAPEAMQQRMGRVIGVPAPPEWHQSAAALEELFQTLDYGWPPAPRGEVPAVIVPSLPRDLGEQETALKKTLFFRTLLPLVLLENERILIQRRFLREFYANQPIDPESSEAEEVRWLARRYKVRGDIGEPQTRKSLLRRVDVLPPALVLAQAANESGWGTSRFAREGNSLFGLWTYRKKQGLDPAAREAGARHAVRAYPNIRIAVRSYLYNLNVGHAYGRLRGLREEMRGRGEGLDPVRLAAGLSRYSVRGEAYVEEIRALIRGNRLAELRELRLAAVELN